jgi:hypothetical protein
MEVTSIEVIAVAAGALLLIGFICGYGARALISHLRRAKAERRDFERMMEEVTRRRKQERPAITFKRGDSTQAPPEGGAS